VLHAPTAGGNRQVANISTKAPFSRRVKYSQVQMLVEYTSRGNAALYITCNEDQFAKIFSVSLSHKKLFTFVRYFTTPYQLLSFHSIIYGRVMTLDKFIHSFILQSVLRQVHGLFQSEFCTECDLVLPLSIYSVLSFPESHPVAAYIFFLVFPSLLPCIF
jgi:hypothetical protein